ncbi:efflux RND transporter permease subunit [Ketobacter alkanivorans]|uniref:Multidrug transporter AcrB n=1 Tax=Ketobacter alkanivorans TaxID=1917421 RepID=A0A2K9LIT0_9GAMM|nr:efflux RND transporter permease subunit [Ketobacter alkanivorans]AUM12182.1 multidrug transporter AcrB [Ketobacter alkanivorans]
MLISDLSVKRPVFASVISLLLIAFGIVAFDRLSLREYPQIDPPVVTIDTGYRGAAASVVETRITQIIEERIAGIEGIRYVESVSSDGNSRITIEFEIDRDIDSAANDVRDRVAGISDDLPPEADPPEIQKQSGDDDVIVWLNLVGEGMTVPELSDYADRYLVDRFSVLNGVARVRVGGGQRYAMRVWLDRNQMAARGLTANDVEAALRAENVELPAGTVEGETRQLTVRVKRTFSKVDDFANLVLMRGDNGYLVRLGDVARVEKGTEESRVLFRGNGIPQVGIGIIKQSTANTIDVARAAKRERERINATLPDNMSLEQSYDSSVFVEDAVAQVYSTLAIAIGLVVLMIYLFLGSARAMLVPAVTVPVSIIATFIALLIFGFSVNLLTLLALVLAIGLVVDDAVVVLENVVRRMHDYGEPPLLAAYRGVRQVGFAVIATTLVLVSVFVPIAFLQGDLGRLFSEFALTMTAAVCFSTLIALTLSPMLASKILKQNDHSPVVHVVDKAFNWLKAGYGQSIRFCMGAPWLVVVAFVGIILASYLLFKEIPSEYSPKEDRGVFYLIVNGPEGATYEYMEKYMDEIERRMMPYVDQGEITRLLVRAPRGFGNLENFNSGIIINVLSDWAQRRSGFEIMNEVREKLQDLPGVRAFPVMRQGFGARAQKPVQFVLGGGTYEQLSQWRDILTNEINKNNPGLLGIDWDYKETQPQLNVVIDYNRAADLGVSVGDIGRTLETMLGSRRVTNYVDQGEEYDVILEGERSNQNTPISLQNIYVKSGRLGQLIPLSNLVKLEEFAGATSLNRYNRVRAITLEANLADDLPLGSALTYLEDLARAKLPESVNIDYKGQSRDYQFAGESIMFIFFLGVIVTYLVLAAQFESYVHPFIIMLTVPLAMCGGLLGLYLTNGSLNIYSQIGLMMLVGLASKNGILIVEFANQLRDQGMPFKDAILEATQVRFRPILITGITTAAGSIPLIMSSGAGSETRMVIGVVVLAGTLAATVFTLFVVPVAYELLARKTGSPGDVARRLSSQEGEFPQ